MGRAFKAVLGSVQLENFLPPLKEVGPR